MTSLVGSSFTTSKVPADARNKKGTDVTITINLSWECKLFVDDGIKKKYAVVEDYIMLGHELVHAYRNMNGYAHAHKEREMYSYYDEHGKLQWETKRKEELIVVGLSKAGSYIYTENALRKEHGLPKRVKY